MSSHAGHSPIYAQPASFCASPSVFDKLPSCPLLVLGQTLHHYLRGSRKQEMALKNTYPELMLAGGDAGHAADVFLPSR